MKAPVSAIESHSIESDLKHLASPCAAVCVALGGAAVVVAAMLAISVPELDLASLIPNFATTLQSLIIG
ncbi:conserved protein of unknown function [Hyphomicrobium sp. 1Nfss2.1]|uniref:hypothetical protein n=1 Tax=Hyphomicrobium sp. 1Nfss2.1 TaxID=3413936 RepID=UPI003C7D38C0